MSNRFLERVSAASSILVGNVNVAGWDAGVVATTRGFETARAVLLASQALPAASAFVAAGPFTIQSGIREVTFWVTYTRDPAASPNKGRPQFRIAQGNGFETGLSLGINTSVTNQPPFGVQSMYEQNLLGPQPSDDNAINYFLTVKVTGGATNITLLAAEAAGSDSGDPNHPGTIAVAVASST